MTLCLDLASLGGLLRDGLGFGDMRFLIACTALAADWKIVESSLDFLSELGIAFKTNVAQMRRQMEVQGLSPMW